MLFCWSDLRTANRAYKHIDPIQQLIIKTLNCVFLHLSSRSVRRLQRTAHHDSKLMPAAAVCHAAHLSPGRGSHRPVALQALSRATGRTLTPQVWPRNQSAHLAEPSSTRSMHQSYMHIRLRVYDNMHCKTYACSRVQNRNTLMPAAHCGDAAHLSSDWGSLWPFVLHSLRCATGRTITPQVWTLSYRANLAGPLCTQHINHNKHHTHHSFA